MQIEPDLFRSRGKIGIDHQFNFTFSLYQMIVNKIVQQLGLGFSFDLSITDPAQ